MPAVALQAGVTGVSSAVNQVMSGVVEPVFQVMLMLGGVAFLIGIIMILYSVVEYIIHPTSFGRSGALSDIFGHHKRIIAGALTLWLAIYIIFLIGNIIGATTANPATVATQVFVDEFKWLFYYLSMAIKGATAPTP